MATLRPLQKQIIEDLGTDALPDNLEARAKPSVVQRLINERVNFLMDYLLHSGAKGYVLGISGGQDSTLAGKLAQMAVDQLNYYENAREYQFVAVRLPYGVQRDEADAQIAIDWIQPHETYTVNIKPAVDASLSSLAEAGISLSDFCKGNTKARERMKVQYDIAAHHQLLVIGTDHAAEAITGFFTKHGDGACDVTPLSGLTKRMGRYMLESLGAPQQLIKKAPTADLEDDRPGLPDEIALGVKYDDLDSYLEGMSVAVPVAHQIEQHFRNTQHKRHLPVSPFDTWWR